MTTPASPPARLRAKALACIAQREHSRVELRRKLLAYQARQVRLEAGTAPIDTAAEGADGAGPDEAAVDALLDWLASRDLLSAERFVETRVQARARRFGNLRIRQELSQHGLALDAEAEATLRHTEPARAHALWTRRFGHPPGDPAERARQTRFLLARGFSADVVRRIVNGTAVEDDGTSA